MSKQGKARRKLLREGERMADYHVRRRRSEAHEFTFAVVVLSAGFVCVCIVLYGVVYYCLGWLR